GIRLVPVFPEKSYRPLARNSRSSKSHPRTVRLKRRRRTHDQNVSGAAGSPDTGAAALRRRRQERPLEVEPAGAAEAGSEEGHLQVRVVRGGAEETPEGGGEDGALPRPAGRGPGAGSRQPDRQGGVVLVQGRPRHRE